MSAAAWEEIAARLRAVDYAHVIRAGEIDLHGIALVREASDDRIGNCPKCDVLCYVDHPHMCAAPEVLTA